MWNLKELLWNKVSSLIVVYQQKSMKFQLEYNTWFWCDIVVDWSISLHWSFPKPFLCENLEHVEQQAYVGFVGALSLQWWRVYMSGVIN